MKNLEGSGAQPLLGFAVLPAHAEKAADCAEPDPPRALAIARAIANAVIARSVPCIPVMSAMD
jgi:hypothetical protein